MHRNLQPQATITFSRTLNGFINPDTGERENVRQVWLSAPAHFQPVKAEKLILHGLDSKSTAYEIWVNWRADFADLDVAGLDVEISALSGVILRVVSARGFYGHHLQVVAVEHG